MAWSVDTAHLTTNSTDGDNPGDGWSSPWIPTPAVTFNLPSVLNVGDVLVSIMDVGDGDGINPPPLAVYPAGWTKVVDAVSHQVWFNRLTVYYRVINGTEGTSITVTFDDTGLSNMGVRQVTFTISAGGSSIAFDQSGVTTGDNNVNPTTNFTPPALTGLATASDLVIAVSTVGFAGVTWTQDAGLTNIETASSFGNTLVGYAVQSTNSSPAYTNVCSANQGDLSASVAFNVAAPSTAFTVSGGGVSMTFPEFFGDVVLTDAPVCRRTN